MRWIALLAAVTVASSTVSADEASRHHSPYVGQETRAIKSLSAEEVADLLAGRGAGFAKAAELNGMPGPAHVLEMRQEIALSAEQEQRIEAVRAQMEKEAKILGARLVALERELNAAFASGAVKRERLRELVSETTAVRGDLRFVHLAAHLETPTILSQEQIRTYNRRRGYAAADPCDVVPPGHDARRWRQHNNCPN